MTHTGNMRAVLQRVTEAKVEVNGQITGAIGAGVLILLGVARDDTKAHAEYLSNKIVNLRIFDDAEGKLNLSLKDVNGQALIVSQFTLYGDCRKGRRPSYDDAARPELAKSLYEHFVDCVRGEGVPVATGVFQAAMSVSLVNDGPVTLICER